MKIILTLAILPLALALPALPDTDLVSRNISAVDGAAGYYYRQFTPYNCNHNDANSDTAPPLNEAPKIGYSGICYDVSRVVRRIETNNIIFGDYTFRTYCNGGCKGSDSSSIQQTSCATAPPNCAIGSFLLLPK